MSVSDALGSDAARCTQYRPATFVAAAVVPSLYHLLCFSSILVAAKLELLGQKAWERGIDGIDIWVCKR